jgi:hypothetical protein
MGSEFYRVEKRESEIVCDKIKITLENLALFANMMTLRKKTNEPPLNGWPAFDQIFKHRKLSSVCTSYIQFNGGRFSLICALR